MAVMVLRALSFDWLNVNALKAMFGPYIETYIYIYINDNNKK